MRIAFTILAFTGFFMSLLVHLTTFFGIDPSKHAPWVWILHLGIFVVCIPMACIQRLKRKKTFTGELSTNMPRWARYVAGAFFAYAIINFTLFFFLSEGGVPSVRNGKYVLHSHGNVIRELSEAEYELQKAYELRGFSGHWMIFYLIPALYFWYREEDTL